MPLDHRYLRLEELSRLRNCVFSSRRAIEGVYAGRHASAQRGQSAEFNDYRQYNPGDPLADVDWKVFGRSDRMFVKLFEHHTEMTVNLVVDSSASMGYDGVDHQRSKFDLAARLSAAIAFLVIRQQDRVGLALAEGGQAQLLPPRGAMPQLHAILGQLDAARPRGRADLPAALRRIADATGRKGLLIVFSDLLDDFDEIQKALSLFTHRRAEVILFHLLHRDELHLPALNNAVFQDSETAQRITLNTHDVRREYDREMRKFLDHWSRTCAARGMDYNLVTTDHHYRQALERYLFSRASEV